MRRDRRWTSWRIWLGTTTLAAATWVITAHAQQAQPGAFPLQLTTARAQEFIDAADRRLHYLPGEVLVKFKSGMGPASQQRALMALRSRPSVTTLRWVGDVAVVTDPTQPDATILASQLSSQPEVDYAEPNYLDRVEPRPETAERPLTTGVRTALLPSDPDFGLQWNFPAIGIPDAWTINPGGNPNLIVAVVDTGVTTVNQNFAFPLWTGSSFQTFNIPWAVSPDLSASRLVSPHDFVFAAPGGAVLDMDSHATHVASTIGEDTNNGMLAGIAYQVKIMPVKVCLGYWDLMILQAQAGIPGFISPDAGGCPIDAIASGIRYAADNGAKVINLSLGGTDPQTTLRDAIVYAVGKGAFVSIAMGNEYEDGNPTEYPAAYAPGIDGAMSVAAVGKTLSRAFYSNTGSYCEIAAPGGDSRVAGTAGEIWQVTMSLGSTSPFLIVPAFNVYVERAMQGTSMATPHVSGMAALLMSQIGPSATPALIEQMIRKTARDLGAPGRDDEYGYGLIQPRTALFGSGIRK
jgi:serine protease